MMENLRLRFEKFKGIKTNQKGTKRSIEKSDITSGWTRICRIKNTDFRQYISS
jgi:hypothetical protein